MRVRHWVLGGAVSLVVVGMTAGGCGGSSDNGPAPDAGQDVTTKDQAAPPADTGTDAAVADTGADACTADADLNNANIPDASLADGATSVGICLGCVKTNCATQVQACNENCDCRTAGIDFFQCVSSGQSILSCAGPLIGGGLPADAQQIGQQLGLCVYAGCKEQCLPGVDGGADAGGDAPHDAADGG